MVREVDERITAGWKRFRQYNTFLKKTKMPMYLKRKLMDSVIINSSHDIWSRNLVSHKTAKAKNYNCSENYGKTYAQ
jgi:hypothetical protein